MESLIKIILSVSIITLILSILLFFTGFLICLPIFLLLAFSILIIAYSVYKKYILCVFPNEELKSFRQNAINKIQEQGYKINDKGEKLYVEKGTFTATGLYFKQNGNQVDVYRTNTATTVAWIAFILGAIFFLIGAIIVGFISESNSKSFAEETIRPLLNNIRCSNCGRLIPKDSRICPYCAKKFDVV
jgi:hypothetical protein